MMFQQDLNNKFKRKSLKLINQMLNHKGQPLVHKIVDQEFTNSTFNKLRIHIPQLMKRMKMDQASIN